MWGIVRCRDQIVKSSACSSAVILISDVREETSTLRQLQTLLHRKILIEKPWFLVNFVQQYFAKTEGLAKCGKMKVCKQNFDVNIGIFTVKRRV